ncbi:nucleoside-diphosphate sugar epimerase [Kibdelosporangium aridum]|uniref:Nucleoside-diphosphate sugar epimerase n=1 Tax=Kibdelosporangium aridum TaxID=2030 RepID=A0A428Y8F0_KIBAR|nr:NAD(P)H-binding protein [Kibdelosporangium aridum]RSM63886.1 nucleoside-diphosphate sugar epimerase [Kibdelosporangium aridum]
MTILVTGATGKVGGQVVSQLSVPVRRFARSTGGDITNVDSVRAALDGVSSVFLVWPFFHTDGVEPIIDAIASSSARRIVYLSSAGDPDWALGVEELIEKSGLEWTFLRPTGFAGNALQWAPEIRASGVVRAPFGAMPRSSIHEYDMAAVGVRALLSDSHVGAKYLLSGPSLVTQVEQVRIIGEVIGRELRFEEQPAEEAKAEMLAAGWPEPVANGALASWAASIAHPEPVTSTVEDVTGRPAKTFREWAEDHADDFKP